MLLLYVNKCFFVHSFYLVNCAAEFGEPQIAKYTFILVFVVGSEKCLLVTKWFFPSNPSSWITPENPKSILLYNSNQQCMCFRSMSLVLFLSNSWFCMLTIPIVLRLLLNIPIVLIFLISSFIFYGIIVSANSFDISFNKSTSSKSQHWVLNGDCLQWILSQHLQRQFCLFFCHLTLSERS